MAVTQFVESNCWRSKTNTDARHMAQRAQVSLTVFSASMSAPRDACQLTTNRCIRPRPLKIYEFAFGGDHLTSKYPAEFFV